ncbi:MAG: hypothetical protein RL711_2086 [Bacteroidota bacterium]
MSDSQTSNSNEPQPTQNQTFLQEKNQLGISFDIKDILVLEMGETNTVSTLDEWMSEQLAARQLSEELNAPLTLVSSILVFAASAFGIAGSFWLVFHYYSRNLLRNTTGLFICVIAYLDIIVALHSIVKALFNFPGIYAWLACSRPRYTKHCSLLNERFRKD